MNRGRSLVRPEPLREFGQGPVYLLLYVIVIITIHMLLVGMEKKSAIAC